MSEVVSPEQAVAQELRAWRNRRDLTAQQLSDRVAELGGSMSRQAISKVENGGRKVTLDELAVLARALAIPPMLLVIPLGKVSEMELYPGSGPVDAWDALKWWTGEVPFDHHRVPAVLEFFRDHDELVDNLRLNREAAKGSAATSAERLRDLRKNMERAGVRAPELPAELSSI